MHAGLHAFSHACHFRKRNFCRQVVNVYYRRGPCVTMTDDSKIQKLVSCYSQVACDALAALHGMPELEEVKTSAESKARCMPIYLVSPVSHIRYALYSFAWYRP